MYITLDVFQLPMGWLKDHAFLNVRTMLVTLCVFQLPMGWLNDVALRNM